MTDKICKYCGTNLIVEEEMFGGSTSLSRKLWTGHSCWGSDEADLKMISKVIGKLRSNGVPCFFITDIIPPELANQIKGRG